MARDFYIVEKMSKNGESPSEDEILKELNRQLEEEKKDEALQTEVKKRREGMQNEPEEPSIAQPAFFKDKGGKKRKASPKKEEVHECPRCGSKESTRLDDGETVLKHQGTIMSQVRRCKDCGGRFGVEK